MKIRVLLLQARLSDDPMGRHEHTCFVERTGLPAEDVVTHDLCTGPPELCDVRRHDALMVGGSGDFYVSERNLPEHEGYLELLREVVDTGHPTFASCFGYQSLVQALGGSVVRDEANTEVGTYELELTEAGRADELFGALPPRFHAQMGHKDRATRGADGCLNLASSERSPFQALRIAGKPIWASQFHPELTRITNLDRFVHYVEGYAPFMDAAERAAAMEQFRESRESSALLGRFLRLVFG
jgi:GMP synthase (glutamine-hydrolysing)